MGMFDWLNSTPKQIVSSPDDLIPTDRIVSSPAKKGTKPEPPKKVWVKKKGLKIFTSGSNGYAAISLESFDLNSYDHFREWFEKSKQNDTYHWPRVGTNTKGRDGEFLITSYVVVKSGITSIEIFDVEREVEEDEVPKPKEEDEPKEDTGLDS